MDTQPNANPLDWLVSRLFMDAEYVDYGLPEALRGDTRDLDEMHASTVVALPNAVRARDEATWAHSLRVGQLTARLAAALRWDVGELRGVSEAGALHDVGKTGIREAVLNKPASLTPTEREHILTHVLTGHAMVRHCGTDEPGEDPPDIDPDLRCLHVLMGRQARTWLYTQQVTRHHQEQWDGTGYPDGLAADEIPEAARLVALCEVYDSLTHDQPWREAWSHDEAAQYIADLRGKAFDPAVTEVFLGAVVSDPPGG